MHQNKNKLMKILCCLVVVGILMSVPPVLASNTCSRECDRNGLHATIQFEIEGKHEDVECCDSYLDEIGDYILGRSDNNIITITIENKGDYGVGVVKLPEKEDIEERLDSGIVRYDIKYWAKYAHTMDEAGEIMNYIFIVGEVPAGQIKDIFIKVSYVGVKRATKYPGIGDFMTTYGYMLDYLIKESGRFGGDDKVLPLSCGDTVKIEIEIDDEYYENLKNTKFEIVYTYAYVREQLNWEPVGVADHLTKNIKYSGTLKECLDHMLPIDCRDHCGLYFQKDKMTIEKYFDLMWCLEAWRPYDPYKMSATDYPHDGLLYKDEDGNWQGNNRKTIKYIRANIPLSEDRIVLCAEIYEPPIDDRPVDDDKAGSVIEKGLDWLRDPDQQKTDGDYVYWTYKGTPNVGVTALVTLAFLNHGYDESDPTVKGALNWLVAQANEDGSISRDTRKVYDTSLAILPLVAAQNEAKYWTVIANARNYLISVQNDEGTGYDPSDRFFGGWGYPKDNWADLSNTQFVVMALDAAGGLTGGVKDNALTFVTRCQNRKESNADYCSYDDGGFVYRPKSGGTSYGSMTAAGLWGLFLCGVNKGDGRLKDALQWLDHDHYSVSANTPIGNKWVYYYDLGLAKAYLMAEARSCEFGKTNWYEDLYAFLSDKQDKEDGHWHNIEGEHSCDVLATAEAILALSVKEVPERISKLSYMVFKLRSAADLHIYDPEGRHVGLNTETGEVEIEIPDATYTENPTEIKVPNLDAGGYKAVLIGTEAGEYELEVIAKTGNKTLAEASYEGWITEGATQEMVTTISSIVGPLDVRLGTLEAVVEAEDSYSEQFSLDTGDEVEIDAIDETGVLLRIEAEEDCEGEVTISDYSENPTIKGFPGEYKYYALEKYVEISLDVDKEKIDWPIYLEVHYDKDELPENVDESTLTIYHYLNDTKWRSCNDFEVNPEENYISAALEKDELCYFGMGGLYAPIWVRYSMILAVIAIMIVLALGYFSVRRFVKSRRVKAMKVPERVPAEVAITIYNFDNSFSLLKEREETAKISDGLDGRLASGEIKEETYNDLKSKYESKIGDLNRKIKSELERAKAYLQRIEDERTKLQRTHESLNAELQKEKGRKKKAEISARIGGISAEIERVDGIIKTMKEKIGVIEGEFSGD